MAACIVICSIWEHSSEERAFRPSRLELPAVLGIRTLVRRPAFFPGCIHGGLHRDLFDLGTLLRGEGLPALPVRIACGSRHTNACSPPCVLSWLHPWRPAS